MKHENHCVSAEKMIRERIEKYGVTHTRGETPYGDHYIIITLPEKGIYRGAVSITIKSDGNTMFTMRLSDMLTGISASQKKLQPASDYAGWVRIECGYSTLSQVLDELEKERIQIMQKILPDS